ncbi:hypothetical protein M9Y10_010314 [Tritrichomonas musculus]|uniref:Clan CD, family C13, asparaginyl endopeptidase-like cysteine peptidase n=1 Tax=Tritrichomonas musculus TaxID=1915356 RepID=A0ABR2ILV4_9EUKA
MLLLFTGLASCTRYAILYAGSKEFYNYRHQADIFTIYGKLLERGFTTNNIALYAYDDIVSDPENPFQGQVFHTIDHKTNVHPGSAAINFKGDRVTAESFYNGITSVPTTSDDYLFIYYNNHGGAGFLGTPSEDTFIEADKLAKSFDKAASSNLYKQCLFLIEACYAGSVGEVLNAPNLATITASNSKESSHAAIFDEEIGVWLTNEFTSNFINLIDESPKMSVGELYNQLYALTSESHALYYGDESIQKVPLSNFIGEPSKNVVPRRSFIPNSKPVNQRKATDMTLDFLTRHAKPFVRAKARIQILLRKTQTEKLETVLDSLVKYVDPKNYEKIMNDTDAKITENYFMIFNIFTEKFGKINPDDYGRLSVIRALAATHSKDEIIQGITAVLI